MRIFLIALLFFGVTASIAQTDRLKPLQAQLDTYNDLFSPEYVSVHTDKDIYFTNDVIWYALYLNNNPRAASALSTVAYVELRDSRDSVIIRQKIRCKYGFAHGDIFVPKKLLTGNYVLAAYTIWMKNTKQEYKQTLPVVNLDIPSPQAAPATADAKRKVAIERSADNIFSITYPAGQSGRRLVAFDKELALMNMTLDENGGTATLNGKKAMNDEIYLHLIEPDGAVDQYVLKKQIDVILNVSASRKEVRPRQKVELTLDLTDVIGTPMQGNVSVSVRTNTGLKRDFEFTTLPVNMLGNEEQPSTRKEIFIYPPSSGSLQPYMMSGSAAEFPSSFNETQLNIIKSLGLRRKVMRQYEMEPFFKKEVSYNLPSNLAYEPANFSGVSTTEEFIRELVPQIRIRKSKDVKHFHVRSSGTSAGVYFFKEPALVLVDGFIIDNVQEVLDVPLQEFERVDITWSTTDINSLGIFALTDNGIISFTTNSRTRFRNGYKEILKGFYTPQVFDVPVSTNRDDQLPMLFDPLYWNPSIRLNGKTKIEFTTGDQPGEIIIEVNGITDLGRVLHAESVITVN